jgi:hypothetical protein
MVVNGAIPGMDVPADHIGIMPFCEAPDKPDDFPNGPIRQ